MEKEVVVLFFSCPQPPSPLLHYKVQDLEWGKSRKEGRVVLNGLWVSHSLTGLMVRGPAQVFSRVSSGLLSPTVLLSRESPSLPTWSDALVSWLSALVASARLIQHIPAEASSHLQPPADLLLWWSRWSMRNSGPVFQAACDGKENRKSDFREPAHGEKWGCKWVPSHENWGSVKSWGGGQKIRYPVGSKTRS